MITPGGTPVELENPPSSEAGLMDSGGGQPLFFKDSREKSNLLWSPYIRHRSNSLSEFRSLKTNKTPKDKNSSPVTAETSKAKIEKEGKWTETTSKRRLQNSPDFSQGKCKQFKLDGYWLSAPVPVSNRFASLENNDCQEKQLIPLKNLSNPLQYLLTM